MTYPVVCLVFVAAAALVAAAAHRAVRRAPDRSATGPEGRGERPAPWRAVALAGAALMLLTAVFDSVMIAAGLFTYSEARLWGPRIGLTPIEDFAYPLAAVMLLPALWSFFAPRPRSGRAG